MSRDLLEELAALAREEHAPAGGDDRLDALMRGELDAAQEQALKEEMSASSQGRAAYEAARPFEQAARDRFIERAKKEMQADARSDAHSDVAEAKVVAIGGGGKSRVIAAAGALLAAAALALLLLWPSSRSELPSYDFRVAGGDQTVRAHGDDDAELPVVGPGSALQLLLRPSVPLEASVMARVFVAADASFVHGRVVDANGVYPLAVAPEISAEGAIRIDVPGEAVSRYVSNDGAWLIVAVASPEALPTTASALLSVAEDDDVQLFSRRIRVRGP